jgi:ABC-2 type transport system ATP-binding protein
VGEAAYCDYVGVLSAGRIVALDTPEGLRRRAYGGELLDIELAAPPTHADLDRLSNRPEVASISWLDDHSVRLVVEDAGAMAATVVEWAGAADLTIERSEPFLPPFDDVFVEIVSAAEDRLESSSEQLAVVGEAS